MVNDGMFRRHNAGVLTRHTAAELTLEIIEYQIYGIVQYNMQFHLKKDVYVFLKLFRVDYLNCMRTGSKCLKRIKLYQKGRYV